MSQLQNQILIALRDAEDENRMQPYHGQTYKDIQNWLKWRDNKTVRLPTLQRVIDRMLFHGLITRNGAHFKLNHKDATFDDDTLLKAIHWWIDRFCSSHPAGHRFALRINNLDPDASEQNIRHARHRRKESPYCYYDVKFQPQKEGITIIPQQPQSGWATGHITIKDGNFYYTSTPRQDLFTQLDTLEQQS